MDSSRSVPTRPQRLKGGSFRLTGPGKGLVLLWAAVTLAAINTSLNLLYLIVAAILGVLATSLLLVLFVLRHVRVQRFLPSPPHAGERAEVRIRLVNTSSRFPAMALTVVEQVEGTPSVSVALPWLAPATAVECPLGITFERRGLHRFYPMRVSTVFPCGFIRRERLGAAGQEMLVYPRLGKVAASLFSLPQQRRLATHTGRARPLSGGEEFYGLREYRAGDHPKRIHWKRSSRFSQLMVKEFDEGGQRPTLTLLLEPQVEGAEGLPLFERTVSFAASFLKQAWEGHHRLLFITANPQLQILRLSPGRGDLSCAFAILALLQPFHSVSLGRWLPRLRGEIGSGSTVIVVWPGGKGGGGAALIRGLVGGPGAPLLVRGIPMGDPNSHLLFGLEEGIHD